jgi:hypothetical protein
MTDVVYLTDRDQASIVYLLANYGVRLHKRFPCWKNIRAFGD